jgi:intermembrane space import and assembly protein 40
MLLDGGTELIDLRGMQDCFRANPEHYGAELEDEEDEVEEELRARQQNDAGEETSTESKSTTLQIAPESSPEPSKVDTEVNTKETEENNEPYRDSANTNNLTKTMSGDEGGELVPKSFHDASKP